MTVAQLAADRGLHRVGARPPLASYLKQTWARRQFIVKMAQFRLRADLDDNRLGVVWLLLQPVLNAIVYGTIFYFCSKGCAETFDTDPHKYGHATATRSH